ncbi:M56 family metallopeptidase [Flavobacterium weaverense]|uniref:TonB-dependent receptor-like protein n=1 Tax=Flavobacterium weaverense TaxID=271156 RepID=A0A3M0A1E8_9FLAO|nr:M56 family metallopeptidase [Flavobacterium weaverense]RMA72812.1 TonB-dependent receptor-like protein [Flavobacterium weaverense]
MEELFIYFLKSSGLLITFYLAYHFLLRKETFFATNRCFLLIGLLTSVFLPLVFYTNTVFVETNDNVIDWNKIPAAADLSNGANATNWYLISAIIYGIGFMFYLLKFVLDFYHLNIVLKGKRIQKQEDYNLLDTTDNVAPYSYFNTIVYNSTLYSTTELENILEHEKVHCQQNHSVDVLVSRVFCIVFWFNPIVWLYMKDILQNLEFIADHEATNKVIDKKAYQFTLLKITTHENCVAITNHFYQSLIKKRIVMLNKNQSKKRNSWKYAVVIPALIAFVMFFQIKVVAQQRNEQTSTQLKGDVTANKLEFSWNKNTTDVQFTKDISTAKSLNIDLVFSKIRRNSKNEITKIKIFYKDNIGNEYVQDFSKSSGIDPIRFVRSIDQNGKGEIGFYENQTQILTRAKDAVLISKEKVAIIDAVVEQEIPKKESLQNANSVKINNQKPKPIIVLNGIRQTPDFDLNSVEPSTIATVNVLKNDKAIEKYGKEAINGVLEIITKNENYKPSTSITTSKNDKTFSFTPLKVSTINRNEKGNIKSEVDVYEMNLDKTDPTNLNNKQYSKKTIKTQYVKVKSSETIIDEAEIYIDDVKSTKAALDKINPNSIDKMDVIKSAEGKKVVKITTKKQ